jgi:hypothetical protein
MISNFPTLESLEAEVPSVFTREPHPRLSQRYRLFSTADIVNSLMHEDWFITRAAQAKARASNRDFTRHFVALSRPGLTYDGNQIEALLFNAHDGTRAFHLEVGIFRSICANGCVWSDDTVGELNLRHLAYSMEAVQEACQAVITRAPEVIARIDRWKNKKLSLANRLALAHYAMSLRHLDSWQLPLEAMLFVRRSADAGDNLWCVFNRLQENITHGGISYCSKKSERNMTLRPIRSISGNLTLNKKLWAAAEAVYQGVALPN